MVPASSAQRLAALLGHEARLGIAGVADDLLEKETVELTVRPAECRIVGDQLGDLGIGEREAERSRSLIEQHLRENLPDHHSVKPSRARLIGGDRTPELAGKLLQPIVVERAELLDGQFGASDLGDGRAAETAKNIADAPDREADHQEADNGGHHRFAEPGGGGFPQPSKHASSVIENPAPQRDIAS